MNGLRAMGTRETTGNRMGRAEALSWEYVEMGMGADFYWVGYGWNG